MIYKEPRFLPGGDKSLFVEFGDTIDPDLNRKVRLLMLAVQKARLPGVIETIPTYRSLLVYYEPLQIEPGELKKTLHSLSQQLEEDESSSPKITEIPTIYGGEYGPDLPFVAEHSSLNMEEVIQIHSNTPYLIYMLGFTPGYPYLGGMSPRIATPRLDTPRLNIIAGSVGIAETQTGIYPSDSPGGWRIIGRTPLKLFDPNQEPPSLLQAGNYLTFTSITSEQFAGIEKQVQQGRYRVKEAPFR
jgi:KipI family sensor histidine kinase inhibitor